MDEKYGSVLLFVLISTFQVVKWSFIKYFILCFVLKSMGNSTSYY